MPTDHLSLFCALVDEVRYSKPEIPADLRARYQFLGMPVDGNSFSSAAIDTHLSKEIRGCLTTSTSDRRFDGPALERELLFQHYLRGDELQPYYDVLTEIVDAQQLRPPAQFRAIDRVAWPTAVSLALHALENNSSSRNDEELLRFAHAREHAQAAAAARLEAAGYPTQVKGDAIVLPPGVRDQLSRDLEALFRQLGGLDVISNVMRSFAGALDERAGRYLFPRRTRPRQRDPIVPVGYFLEVGIRFATAQDHTSPQNLTRFKRLIALAQDFTALLDIESYHDFDSLVFNLRALMTFMLRAALYDTVVALPQWNPKLFRTYVTTLFDWLPDASCVAVFGARTDELIDIASHVVESGATGPAFQWTLLTELDLARVHPFIDHLSAYRILKRLSIRPSRDFILPDELEDAQLGLAPLVEVDGGFVALPPSVAAPACFNAVCASLRDAGVPDLDRRVGLAFERLIAKLLDDHNVSYIRGKYRAGRTTLEIDFAIETEQTVILIEVKKKALTRRARAAQKLALLADLARSLIAAHRQLASHELQLRKKPSLTIRDETRRGRILALSGRSIERVAVTLNDFGPLQDRFLARNVLSFLPNAEYSVDLSELDKEEHRQFNDLVNETKKLRDVERELAPLRGDRDNRLGHCSFISSSQLCTMLTRVVDNDSLLKELRATRSLTTGTLDFYTDYNYVRDVLDAKREGEA